MTPTAAILMLDRQLAKNGEPIRLVKRAGLGVVSFEVTCQAMVRGYDAEALTKDQSLTQLHRQVILSPTEITEKGWPGAQLNTPTSVDPRVPVNGDEVIFNGVSYRVERGLPIKMMGVLVRLELRVKG